MERIASISGGRFSHLGLADGRARSIGDLQLFGDSVSYIILPGARLERVHGRDIRSIDFVSMSRTRGILKGASLGAALGLVAGPILEYWAGSRGGPLALSAPMYAGAWGLIGGGIGAIVGDRQNYHYEANLPSNQQPVPVTEE